MLIFALRLALGTALLLALSAPAVVARPAARHIGAQAAEPQPLFRDQFRDGKPELDWQPFPGFSEDNLKGTIDTSSPEPDHGVGVLTNANAGGFAALSYATAPVPRDFALDTWLYATTTQDEKGALNGVAFRVDPVGQRFYRVASQFAARPTLSIAYVGRDTLNYPLIIHTWGAAEIPGGAPTASGWHRLRVEVVRDQAEVYWDGVKLPGGPFAIDRVSSGYVGVYATYTGGLGRAETRVGSFTVEQLGSGLRQAARRMLPMMAGLLRRLD